VYLKFAANEQVLPMVGKLKTLRLATEVHDLFKDEKFILMFKRVPSARTKAESDMLPIAPTSSPTIGNTLVEPNRQAGNFCNLQTVSDNQKKYFI